MTRKADCRAADLWAHWREQKERCEQLEDLPNDSEERCTAAHKTLFAIENELRLDFHASVVALAATLVVQIDREEAEDVEGLHLASLAAIRPQLVGAIAEDADRVLALGGTLDDCRHQQDNASAEC
jgi:hypothetical protein